MAKPKFGNLIVMAGLAYGAYLWLSRSAPPTPSNGGSEPPPGNTTIPMPPAPSWEYPPGVKRTLTPIEAKAVTAASQCLRKRLPGWHITVGDIGAVNQALGGQYIWMVAANPWPTLLPAKPQIHVYFADQVGDIVYVGWER